MVANERQHFPADVGLALRTNLAWTFAGNFIYAACQWGVLVVIAKTLTAADVGEFALGLAVTAPIMILANQGLRDLQATDATTQFAFRDYVGYRLGSTAAALFFIALLSYLLKFPAVVLLVGISKAFESLSDVVYGRYQRHDRMDRTATSMVLRGILAVGLVTPMVVWTRSIVWCGAALVAANVLVLALYDLRHARLGPRFMQTHPNLGTQGRLCALAMIAIPLGLAQMLNSVASNIPRYFLESYAGAASLGVFAAIMYLVLVGRTVIGAVAQSCVARLARLHVARDRAGFRSLLLKQLAFGLLLGVGGIIFSLLWGGPFLRVVYRTNYAQHTDIFVLAMVLAAVNYLAEFTGTALTAVRQISVQPFILATCAVASGVLCFALVPRYGLAGASWAALLTGVLQLLIYVVALRRSYVTHNWV